ncbi:MAG: N-acetyltransferase family protein [Candidatus Heimdallarchaeota archaeon]
MDQGLSHHLEIIKIHPAKAKDALIDKILDFQEVVHHAYYVEDKLNSREFRRMDLREAPREDLYYFIFYTMVKDKIVSIGYIWYHIFELEHNSEFCEFYIETHPNYSRQGIGKKILRELKEDALKEGKENFEVWFRSKTNIAALNWINKLNLKFVITEKKVRLYRQNINQAYIALTHNKYADTLKQYDFVTHSKEEYDQKIIDDQFFSQQLVDFLNEAVNLIPKGNSDQRDQLLTVNDLGERAKASLKTKWGH